MIRDASSSTVLGLVLTPIVGEPVVSTEWNAVVPFRTTIDWSTADRVAVSSSDVAPETAFAIAVATCDWLDKVPIVTGTFPAVTVLSASNSKTTLEPFALLRIEKVSPSATPPGELPTKGTDSRKSSAMLMVGLPAMETPFESNSNVTTRLPSLTWNVWPSDRPVWIKLGAAARLIVGFGPRRRTAPY